MAEGGVAGTTVGHRGDRGGRQRKWIAALSLLRWQTSLGPSHHQLPDSLIPRRTAALSTPLRRY